MDSSNNIWVGSFDNGLSKFDGTEWTSFNTNNGALGHDYILSLEVDNSGNVWVAAGDAGIYKFDGDTWTNYKTSNSGILANSIFCSASDNNGLLWFGYGEIFGFGVFNGSEWAHYDVNNSNLPNNISYTIFSDSEDNIWIGTISGLSKFKYDSSGEFLTTTIIPNYQVVGYEAGSATFEISSNTSWSASDAADWLYFPTLTGNSNDKITAQYSYNHSEYSRTATITVSGTGVDSVTATIIQSVQTPTITVSPSNCHVSAESGSTIFNILSNTNWTASDDSDWLIISPSSGVNDATLTANYEENTTANARTATITVSGSGLNISATVTQDYYNSIYETTLSRQIKVYPTPAVNSIAVKFNDISQMVQKICMVDMQGRVVLIVDDNKLNSDNIQIDVSKLPKGVFYLNILLDKELVVKKIPIVR